MVSRWLGYMVPNSTLRTRTIHMMFVVTHDNNIRHHMNSTKYRMNETPCQTLFSRSPVLSIKYQIVTGLVTAELIILGFIDGGSFIHTLVGGWLMVVTHVESSTPFLILFYIFLLYSPRPH